MEWDQEYKKFWGEIEGFRHLWHTLTSLKECNSRVGAPAKRYNLSIREIISLGWFGGDLRFTWRSQPQKKGPFKTTFFIYFFVPKNTFYSCIFLQISAINVLFQEVFTDGIGSLTQYKCEFTHSRNVEVPTLQNGSYTLLEASYRYNNV